MTDFFYNSPNTAWRIAPVGFISNYHGFAEYDDRLISTLTLEHREILATYYELSLMLKQGDYKKDKIMQFLNMIENHILLEDSHFYPTLLAAFKHTPRAEEIIQSYRARMEDSSQTVACSLQKTQQYLKEEKSEISLQHELLTIGGVLRERITFEENVLHPVYLYLIPH